MSSTNVHANPVFGVPGARERQLWRGNAQLYGCASALDVSQRSFDVAALFAGLDRLALVESVLAAAERDLDLRAPVLEVDPRRHDRQAALGHTAEEPLDLAPVGEQLARPLGLVVVLRGRLVGRDVDVLEPQLALLHVDVAVLDLGAALAQRLDLGALQDDAALELVEQLEAVRRLAVRRDVGGVDLALALGHLRRPRAGAGGPASGGAGPRARWSRRASRARSWR